MINKVMCNIARGIKTCQYSLFNSVMLHRKIYSTQSVLYPFLVLAQYFALFPVTGIKGKDFNTISFSWQSKRAAYAGIYLVISLTNLGFYFIKQINSKEFLSTFVGLIYFTTTVFTGIFFISLARKWPCLMEKWGKVDSSMARYAYSCTTSQKLTLISLFVMGAALIEHSIFVASRFAVIQTNITTLEKIDDYFKTNYDQFFDIIPYNIYMGIFIQVFNIYCVFAWNYKDLFIILISMILSQRFTQIVKKVRLMSKYKITKESHWRSVREDYIRLTALCKSLDSAMTNIVILSFTHNLFILLIQFMYTLYRSDQTFIHRIYFIYSFGFLIMRTICVCLFAAEIDHESKEPLKILTSLPSDIYNIEIERFILQVTIDPAYLSGGEFFVITRSLVLRISGAIVTYELVLIQMYNNT